MSYMTISELIAKRATKERLKITGKNIGKTVGMTLLMNIITLPFGRVSTNISYSKVTQEEIKAMIEQSFYYPLDTQKLEEANLLEHFTTQMKILIPHWDKTLTTEQKESLIELAINNPREYRRIIIDIIAA